MNKKIYLNIETNQIYYQIEQNKENKNKFKEIEVSQEIFEKIKKCSLEKFFNILNNLKQDHNL